MKSVIHKTSAAVAALLAAVPAHAHPGHVHLAGSPFHGWSWYEALPLLFLAAILVAVILRNRD